MNEDKLKKSAILLMKIMKEYDSALGLSGYILDEKDGLLLYVHIIKHCKSMGVMDSMVKSLYLELPGQKNRKEKEKTQKKRFAFFQSIVQSILYHL